jgi:hypothetical protein
MADNSELVNLIFQKKQNKQQNPDNISPIFQGHNANIYSWDEQGAWNTRDMGRIDPRTSTIIESGSNNVDDLLARKQLHMLAQSKRALTGASQNTKLSSMKYFQTELKQNSEREWWGENDE